MAEQPKARPEAAPTETRKPASPARRRWLQAGLSAPPVLMTVVSRPVLGATQFCVPPSAYVSLPTSTPGMYGDCNGKGPTAWVGTASWPLPYCKGPGACGPGFNPTRFNDIFGPTVVLAPPNITFLGVLTGSYSTIAKLVVAAALNSASGSPGFPLVPANVLPLATILHIWTESNGGTGTFSPSPGFTWSPAEIEDYLKSTMVSA